ncbi:TonB-linked outer membrane protein, SusC/RagA family [Mucilaginibacter gossypiicola]|uniref:TonB-linked outer membrane protein, SusC/RagA family n=1 Tax=Mucilaginibacter gossypiicola TaxID=551995 RepID=A0A1H8QJS3_9SPHI|nr:SusC/RagA family TonB-linked outer membrane protein [Mucilaginibacter gossypiicola]SEO54490.1 TonB-linked outer membrane protein, SusC/RagA family [Mucilaginibacter gossypiicola]
MRKHILFYIVLAVCMIFSCIEVDAQAQNITVTGTVVEKATNKILPGVNIYMGSKGLIQTDYKGKFTVNVPANATLTFTFVGFVTEKVKLEPGQKNITVTMTEDKKGLNEVVIVAYQNRNKESTPGASVTITAKDIQDVPTSNVESLLQGKVAGLNVQNNTGAPGFRGSVQVRGLSTLSVSGSGSESFLQPTSPLYIIDGVPLDADKAAEFGFQTQGPGVSPLSLIPVEDIQSIQVMKDAQATSMYGSRGAYGVIIITTKRGNSKVPRVRYTGNFFVNATPQLRATLGGNSERQAKIQQILSNATIIDELRRLGQTGFLADSLNAYWNNSTNWQSIFYGTTHNQSHNVALDGGNDRFNYKANMGYYSEKGVIKNTGFDRYNLNMNMEFKPNDKFRFFGSLFGSLGSQAKGNGVGLLQQGVATNGQASTLLPPPSFYLSPDGVTSALQTQNSNSTRNIRTNVDGRYEFIPGLALSSSISYDYTSDAESTFTPAAANAQFAQMYDYEGRSFTLYNRNALTYAKTFGSDHTIFVNTFNEIYKQGGQSGIIRQSRIPNDQLQGPVGSDSYNSRGGGVLSNYKNATIASFAGSFNYDYKKKYVLELSYRLDGTSSNGLENPYSKNPAAGFRWNYYKENWFKDWDWLTSGGLRLTWGQNIVPTGSLQSIYGLYNLNGNFNNNPTIGINYEFVPNPSLKPTTTTQYNLGFDMTLLQGKVDLTFDTYYKKVDNLLFDRFLPNSTGFQKKSSNDVSIADYGYELMVTVRPITGKDFNWTVSFNGAINRDYLLRLPSEYNGQYIKFDYNNYQHIVFRVGKNTLSNYLLVNQGVYSNDADVPVDPVTGKKYQTSGLAFKGGDPRFKDVNGDYILDDRDYEITGNSQPLITGGVSTNINYKNFGLNVYATYTAKRTILNNALSDRLSIMKDPYALLAAVPLDDLDIWRKPGDQSKYPNPYSFSRFNQIRPLRSDQSLWQEEGSYLKINTVTLSYMFDKKFVRRFGFNNVRVYFSTNNLITFSGYNGPNPENVTSLGRDISSGYPVPRTYNLGLNIELNTSK